MAEQGLVAVPEQALAAGLQGGHAAAGLVVQQAQQLAPAQPVAVSLVHHAVQGRQQHLHRPPFCSQLGITQDYYQDKRWHMMLAENPSNSLLLLQALPHHLAGWQWQAGSQKGQLM